MTRRAALTLPLLRVLFGPAVVLVLACALLSQSQPADSPAAAAPPVREAVLLYTADANGAVGPCGCAGGPSGGLSKLTTALRAYRQGGRPCLLVQAGDLTEGKREAKVCEIIGQAAARLQFDAINLGPHETRQEPASLQKWLDNNKLPLVSANLAVAAAGEAAPAAESPWKPWRIVERGGIRFGIIGVVAPRWFRADGREFFCEEPRPAVERALGELRGRADVVVLLYGGDSNEARELAREATGLDIVVCGHTGRLLAEPVKEGRTLIVQPGANGDRLGAIVVRLDGERGVVLSDHRLITLTGRVRMDPDILKLGEPLEKASGRRKRYDTDKAPLRVETAAACGKCHEKEYAAWQKTPHARSMAALAEKHADEPACGFCHASGLLAEGGFVSVEETADLANVSCQACHPTDSSHGEKKERPGGIHVSPETCQQCHTAIDSPKFSFRSYYRKVVHTASP
ncbi:MAG TPA: multiheme c-type cytochrome [Phycisphaerae bacterium]|nr:multiheme c-type cytochrome [Phycisphaerae bacterium]